MEKALKRNNIFFGIVTITFYGLFIYSLYSLILEMLIQKIDIYHCLPVMGSLLGIMLSYLLWSGIENNICQKYDRKRKFLESENEYDIF